MPIELDYTRRPPARPPIPVAAGVMLGLVLGMFGYTLFFVIAFTHPVTDPIVYAPLLALAPAAGVIAWLCWPHWRTVAACVALPTLAMSLFAWIAVAREGKPDAAAHLGIAAAAVALAFAGAFVGRTFATRQRQKS